MRILKNLFTKPRKIIDSLFAGMALLIIIPITILGISLTLIFSSGLKRQTDRINSNSIDYVLELWNENLGIIYNTAYMLGNNEDILKHGNLKINSYEYATNLERISTALRRQQLQCDMLQEIYVFYRDSGELISSNSGKLTAKETVQTRYGLSMEELSDFLPNNSMKFIRSVEVEKNKYTNLLFAKCIDTKFNKVGNIYVIYVLDGQVIRELIDMINVEGVGYSLILDGQYQLLLGDEKIYLKYEKYFQYTDTHIETNTKASRVLVKEVEKGRLKLCFIIDNAYYVDMIRLIWVTIICIGISIVVISVFISRFYIRRLYRPFGNIINMFKPDEEEYGSKSELEFFEEKYIEIKDMKANLASYKASEDNGLREMFFYNFLKGFYCANYELYIQDMDITFEEDYYTVLSIKIDNFRAIVQNIKLSYYRRFVKDKLLGILQKRNPSYYGKMFYFYDSEYIGFMICHNREITDIKHEITFLQHELLKMLDITISVCVSDTVTRPEDLVEEYKVLSNAMYQMKYCKPSTIITMQDYRKIGKYVDFSRYKNAAIQAISERNYEKLDTLIDKAFEESNLFYTEVIQLVTGFLTVSADLMEKSGNRMFSKNVSEIHPYDEIGGMSSATEIATYIKNFCYEVGELLFEESSNKCELYNKIMSYIAQNYMKDISLTVMAEDFGLSSSYFSRCFKEVMGKNYSEMISSYRLEKAKGLIDNEEEIKMFQVAELVGFASYKAFQEAFKKYTGMSPESYRKEQKGEQ